MAFDLLKARFEAVALAKSQVDGLQNLEAEKPLDTDFQIDRFIREWRNLPPRPEGAPPYQGLGFGRVSVEVLLTLQQLRHVMPQAKSAQAFLDPLNDCMQNYQISTPLRKAAFLAQLAHESGQLIFTREIWGPTAQQRKYEPGTRLAATLGNTQPGDGSLYRGRGLIQLTGRANYRSYTRAVRQRDPKAPDFETSPNDVAAPQWATDCAGWFWTTRRLNPLADAKEFKIITKRINGGFNGLEDRMKFYQRALDAFL